MRLAGYDGLNHWLTHLLISPLIKVMSRWKSRVLYFIWIITFVWLETFTPDLSSNKASRVLTFSTAFFNWRINCLIFVCFCGGWTKHYVSKRYFKIWPHMFFSPLLFSSLCMVPVTLMLSNCSLAQVDVIIDLRHKTTRYISTLFLRFYQGLKGTLIIVVMPIIDCINSNSACKHIMV